MECGNPKKSDVVVSMIRNHTEHNSLSISSKYDALFGRKIKEVIDAFVDEKGLKGLDISIEDYGAWDYTLLARLEACLDGLGDDEHEA
ncbi:MAG TPA: hypothetical protein PK466_12065 [Thermotogota bacterium]|nr:hypothetical protein [Thermotogota bacterium]HPJ90000.1 hypothetical protein [Thermotogota bacterium]HPR97060.1 hypothetical protein [Thermotogota bacterium]